MEVVNWRDLIERERDAGLAGLARPEHVGGFFAEYAQHLRPERVLDPFAASPVLAAAVAETSPEADVTAIVPWPRPAEMGRAIAPSVRWKTEEPSTFIRRDDHKYDLIVSSPPLGLRRSEVADGLVSEGLPPSSVWRSEFAHLVLCLAVERLTPDGKLVFLLGQSSLFGPGGERMRTHLAERQIEMVASISFRDGLVPLSHVETHAAVFARRPSSDLFIARIGPTTPRREVIENLVQRRPGSEMELGALVDASNYRGWQLAAVNRELEASLDGSAEVATIGAVALEIKPLRLRREEPDPAFENALYLPEVGAGPARLQVDWSVGTTDTRSVVAVVLDSGRADAEYVAQWLNSPPGKLARRSLMRGTVPRIARLDLTAMHVPLPPLEVQQRSVVLRRRIAGLRAELDALGDRIATSASRDSLDSATWDLRRLVEGDDVEAWADRLPFPIASILGRYLAEADPRGRHDRLLFFFEAFAAFAATLLLSAARSNEKGWAYANQNMTKPGLLRGGGLQRADFGRWMQIGTSLAASLRGALCEGDESTDDIGDSARSAALGVADPYFHAALVDTEMWRLLDQARVIRNRHKGHGGDVSIEQLQKRVRELEQVLGELHQRASRAFDGVMLVQPGESGYDGGAHRFRRARRLMGATSIFKEVGMNTVFPLKAEGLYLVDRSENPESFLEVLPLVRLVRSPETEENVCYFYNALSKEGTLRFVSYHFPGEVDISAADAELEGLL